MVASIDDRADVANTEISTTRATPIISADAVAAVRFGLRAALSRASTPVIPRNAATGAPTSRTKRGPTTGPSTTTPANTARAPTPIGAAAAAAGTGDQRARHRVR